MFFAIYNIHWKIVTTIYSSLFILIQLDKHSIIKKFYLLYRLTFRFDIIHIFSYDNFTERINVRSRMIVHCYWGGTPTAHKAYITVIASFNSRPWWSISSLHRAQPLAGSLGLHSETFLVYSSHHRARHLPALRDSSPAYRPIIGLREISNLILGHSSSA